MHGLDLEGNLANKKNMEEQGVEVEDICLF